MYKLNILSFGNNFYCTDEVHKCLYLLATYKEYMQYNEDLLVRLFNLLNTSIRIEYMNKTEYFDLSQKEIHVVAKSIIKVLKTCDVDMYFV